MVRSLKSIGLMIKKYRKRMGYSQEELSKKYGVTIAAISSWERGVSRPGIEVAFEMATDMNLSLEEFFVEKIQHKHLKLSEKIQIYGGELFIDKINYSYESNQLDIDFIFTSHLVSKAWIEKTFFFSLEQNHTPINPLTYDVEEKYLDNELTNPKIHKGYQIHLVFAIESANPLNLILLFDEVKIIYTVPPYILSLFSEQSTGYSFKDLSFIDVKDALEFLIQTRADTILKDKIQVLAGSLKP
jgi:transcriptional regulator with XRE-family HTH domain